MIRPHIDYDLYDEVVRELRGAERFLEEQRAEIERLRGEAIAMELEQGRLIEQNRELLAALQYYLDADRSEKAMTAVFAAIARCDG